jgi:hypothetical protein
MKAITIPTTNINYTVTDDWQDVPPAPEQSPNTLTFNIIGQGYRGAMAVQTIEPNAAMPFGQDESVIATIHEKGIDDQSGLLAIKSVTSPKGVQFVYSLFKRLIPQERGGGIMYTLTIYIQGDNAAYQIQSMIGEYGMTGMRDSVILSQMLSQGKVTMTPAGEGQQPKMRGWSSDPYDPSFTKGVPMNLSEGEEYDAQFPNHPLSVIRKLLREITETIGNQ